MTVTQAALIEAPDKLSPRHGHAFWQFLRHTNDLPRPVTAEMSSRNGRLHVSITMLRSSDVEAWAEALSVDTEHERIADGVWTDRAEGLLDVYGSDLLDNWVQVEVRYHSGHDAAEVQ